MRRYFLFPLLFILLGLFFSLNACVPDWLMLPTATPTQPPATATVTPSPTSTRVWFPPTATNTLSPNQNQWTATPDLRPLENEVLFTDDFSDNISWEQVSTIIGTASYGNNEFTLALKGEKGSLYSFPTYQVSNDYYLEMMIEPALCSGSDQYGIIFRTQSRQEFYRFSMGCDGHLQLDLVQGNSAVRLVEADQPAQLFSGPNAKLKLSLWVAEDGVKIFVNDILQAEYYRLRWYTGNIGIFARSYGGSVLTVSFSDLTLRSSSPLPPTPVPTLTPTPKN